MNDIKVRKATGPDEISAIIFKQLTSGLVLPVTKVMNCGLLSGVFPDCLEIAMVEPIPNDKLEKIFDFRPISILSVFSKVFERFVHTQIDENPSKINFSS